MPLTTKDIEDWTHKKVYVKFADPEAQELYSPDLDGCNIGVIEHVVGAGKDRYMLYISWLRNNKSVHKLAQFENELDLATEEDLAMETLKNL